MKSTEEGLQQSGNDIRRVVNQEKSYIKFGFFDVVQILIITMLCGIGFAIGYKLATNPQGFFEAIKALLGM